MSIKLKFCFFILCGFLYEGIVQVLSENVVRRKRVINEEPDGEEPVQNGVAPYVVNVKGLPENVNICVGSILSKHTVLTAAGCVIHYDIQFLKIQTGSAQSYLGTSYNIADRKVHIGNHPLNIRDGIALLIIYPTFIFFNQNTRPVLMHEGDFPIGTRGTIFGWGHNFCHPIGTNYRRRLRSITLPVMNYQECANIYRNRAVISNKHLCTYHPQKRCGHTDSGAPLVVHNRLAGIYIWTGATPNHINPDVFIFIQDFEYTYWIRNNTVN